MRRLLGGCMLAVASAAGCARAADGTRTEPPGLWHGPMHSETPATLHGATVIDVNRMAAIVAHDKPVLIDVANLQRRPVGWPQGKAWEPVHRSVPGVIWMPGAGTGTDDPKFADAFAAQAKALTGGDKGKPIVAFCHPQRWGSWNVAKRLTELGYKQVYWFPGGSEGWMDKHDAVPVKEDARWKAMGFDKDSSAGEPATQ